MPLQQLDRGRTARILSGYFGARGIRTVSVPAELLTYPGPGALRSVQVGRAFLKVDRPGRTVFVMEMAAVQHGFSCLAELRVGGAPAGSLNFYVMGRGGERPEQSMQTVPLSIGYYPMEYVAVCGGALASFTIKIRDENDAGPRAFRPDELFHVFR
ncbi:hypothetical protein [Xanthobacter wiegelii]|uniref:hypothetical protein n=1 Tax=Xanthobacter wiegelii TaxID=3119913 RepID=UPI0037297E03